MKKLLTTAAILTFSVSAFAGAEIQENIIPGHGVVSKAPQQNVVIVSELRAEPLATTIPGYGSTPSKVSSQPSVGNFEVDYLGMSFEGAQ